MKISLNWILDYIPGLTIPSYSELEKAMISAGLDIESVEKESDKYRNFVVGAIHEVTRHPNAEKLTVCKVDTGEKLLNIVCGAQNVEKGQKVCVALEGAVIPKDGIVIKKSKIRSELSEGMICAEDELDLSGDHSGIMVLNENATTGINFSDYIKANDVLFEIGVTPNRGDLFSQMGMAREIAAIYNRKIVKPAISIKESEKKSGDFISIEIESREFCKRFTGRVVRNVKISDSPLWLKKRLTSVGLRPINNIVDITNFVMLETGQPLHAFDYDKIRKNKIIVKTAKSADKFITLDSKERILNDKSLMVCDGEGYSGIAGVMGGESSEITSDTKNVFIESAYFDPVNIRKNSKMLGLQTDASQRFERGIDMDNVVYASNRAAQLMQELSGGEVCKNIIDVYPEKFENPVIGVRNEMAEKLLGITLGENLIIELLDKIEIRFTERKNGYLYFEIPEFRRNDISREADLIEEVARMYGYDNIRGDFIFNIDVNSHLKIPVDFQNFEIMTRQHFIGRGFNEIISYSQEDYEILKNFSAEPVKIDNPNSVEMNAMRCNLVYGMLEAVRNNANNLGKEVSLKLFEIGKVFSHGSDSFSEKTNLCFSLSGKNDMNHYSGGDGLFDILDLKGELEIYISKLNLEIKEFIYYNTKQNFLELRVKGKIFGRIEKISDDVLVLFGLKQDVYLCEIDLDVLSKLAGKNKVYKTISKFPVVKRDLALIADKRLPYLDITGVIYNSGGKILKDVNLFDIYADDRLGADKKSMGFSLEFQSDEKTLTDEEVSKQVDKIIRNLKKELNIELRS